MDDMFGILLRLTCTILSEEIIARLSRLRWLILSFFFISGCLVNLPVGAARAPGSVVIGYTERLWRARMKRDNLRRRKNGTRFEFMQMAFDPPLDNQLLQHTDTWGRAKGWVGFRWYKTIPIAKKSIQFSGGRREDRWLEIFVTSNATASSIAVSNCRHRSCTYEMMWKGRRIDDVKWSSLLLLSKQIFTSFSFSFLNNLFEKNSDVYIII